MIRDSGKIARAYLKGWFSIDLLASIPFDALATLIGIDANEQVTLLAFLKVGSLTTDTNNNNSHPFSLPSWASRLLARHMVTQSVTESFAVSLQTPRLLRLGRLLRFFERMKNANVFRIFRLMATMCMVSHWIACIWHFLYMQIHSVKWLFDREEYQVENAPSAFLVGFYNAFILMVWFIPRSRHLLHTLLVC